MANFVYDQARNDFLNGELSWANNTFKVILLSSAYVANQSQHKTLADIPQSARIAVSDQLSGKQSKAGVAYANSITVVGVPSQKIIKSFVIVKQNNTDAESQTRLVAYIDTAQGITGTNNSGLTTTGADIKVEWGPDSDPLLTAKRIFKL